MEYTKPEHINTREQFDKFVHQHMDGDDIDDSLYAAWIRIAELEAEVDQIREDFWG